jgi:protein-S-isoprenylcysteine O-methyltransferase Ste14
VTKLEIAAFCELIVCWLLWAVPFFLRTRQQPKNRESVTAPVSRWGVAVQAAGFFLAWLRSTRGNPPAMLIASMILAPLATWLAWRAVTHLGKQWRIQAGVYSDHELIRTGPYAVIRHPIYTSMLGMLIATGLIEAHWLFLIGGVVLFVIGIEVRIRAEEALLSARFGEAFREYRAKVPAYIPFVR